MNALIPPTSKEHYLTGYTALNIHSSEDTGDWHTLSVFKGTQKNKPGPIIIAGLNFPSSYRWLGDSELIDCREFLINQKVHFERKNNPVWACTHYRAIVDYVLYLLEKNGDLKSYIELDAWLPEEQEKERCFSLLKKIKKAGGFSSGEWQIIKKWIKAEKAEN